MKWIPTIITLAALLSTSSARSADQPMIHESAPGFRLESLHHGEVGLEDFRGKTVVLHFGTGW